MAKHSLPLLLTACALTLSACLDDPAVRERLGVDEAGKPLNQATGQPAMPDSSASPTFARTPGPSQSTKVLTPSGTPSDDFPTPKPSATVTGTAPGVTGRYTRTFDPLDVAIAGPGYLVLATRPDPQSLADLLFSRSGGLELRLVPTGSPAPGGTTTTAPGEWRLETSEGLFVLGFTLAGENPEAPPEGRGTDWIGAFGSFGRAVAGPLVLDSLRNADIQPSFNFKGQLLTHNRAPVGTDGEAQSLYVAVAQFESPQGLVAKPGFPAYTYAAGAGVIQVGIAGIKPAEAGIPRPVGDANLIRPETLEH